ncbi:MAG: histone deacetylase [Verrucomicrobiota bacterium]|nr:histone deacetylase [Verrucomicrobiota bacterium]
MESKLPTAILSSVQYIKHDPGLGHPEKPARIEAVMQRLRNQENLKPFLDYVEPRPATEADLLRVHTPVYCQTVRRDVQSGARDLSTGDTAISEDSYHVALLATGAALTAIDLVVSKKASNAFCVVRPPGHHASPNRGMGFCLFNSIAIAARYGQAVHKLGKVLIADWDVHHGNGTQDTFYEDGSVLFFDTHQHPWYPGTGEAGENGSGKGLNCIINNPFPAGAGSKEIVGAFETKLVKAAQKFKPDLVLLSAGFDSRAGDPLGHFKLSDEDFARLTEIMSAIAKEHCEGRLVSLLEGGYSLEGLANAAVAHVGALTRHS